MISWVIREIDKMLSKSKIPKDERKIVVHNLTEMISIVVHNLDNLPKESVSIVVHNLTEMVSIVVHNLEKRPNPADFTKIVVHNLEELVKK